MGDRMLMTLDQYVRRVVQETRKYLRYDQMADVPTLDSDAEDVILRRIDLRCPTCRKDGAQ